MSASTIISEAYGESACLYETVLGVSRDATPSQLRKAYYKRCLSYHPDKLTSDLPDDEIENAKSKFRAISVAYSILSDEGKRKEYDESGDMYDEDDDDMATGKGGGVDSWKEYFDVLFPKVTEADIDAFEVKYKCSDEEENDVLKYYARFKGDLNKMLECVMLSSDADKARWVEDYIRPAIERGEADDHAAKIEKTLLGGSGKVVASSKTTTKATGGGGEKRNGRGGGGRRGGGKKAVEKTTGEDDGGESDDESDTPVAQVMGGGTAKKDRASSVSADDDASSSKKGKSPPSKKKKKTGGATSTTDGASKKEKKNASSSSSSSAAAGGDRDDDLIARIRGNALARRKEGFDTLMAGLEERYGGGGGGGDEKEKTGRGGAGSGKKKKKRQQQDDGDIMDDDEFAKVQAKIMKNKGRR